MDMQLSVLIQIPLPSFRDCWNPPSIHEYNQIVYNSTLSCYRQTRLKRASLVSVTCGRVFSFVAKPLRIHSRCWISDLSHSRDRVFLIEHTVFDCCTEQIVTSKE